MKRLMYWPPGGVTRPWLPRVFRGGDEWHNPSIGIVVPFLGALIVFYGRGYTRHGIEHLWGAGPEGTEGAFHEDCLTCREIKAWFEEDA